MHTIKKTTVTDNYRAKPTCRGMQHTWDRVRRVSIKHNEVQDAFLVEDFGVQHCRDRVSITQPSARRTYKTQDKDHALEIYDQWSTPVFSKIIESKGATQDTY